MMDVVKLTESADVKLQSMSWTQGYCHFLVKAPLIIWLEVEFIQSVPSDDDAKLDFKTR